MPWPAGRPPGVVRHRGGVARGRRHVARHLTVAEIRTFGSNYEAWFLSQGIVGFVNAGGAAFLVAPMIIDQGGSPADAGMIVGLLPFVALLSPVFGKFNPFLPTFRTDPYTPLRRLRESAPVYRTQKTPQSISSSSRMALPADTSEPSSP